jgi:hypothetical protein
MTTAHPSPGPRVGWRPFSYDRAVASVRLRSLLPCLHLSRAGFRASIIPPDGRGDYDCVVFQKAYQPQDLRLAERYKARGTKVVFDLVDNHFYNPDADPVLAERVERLQQMVTLADAISVSTPELATLVAPRKPFLVDCALEVPRGTAIARRWAKAARTRRRHFGHRRVRLVWHGQSGSESPPSGIVDVGRLVPALEELNRHLPLRLTVISNSRPMFERHVGQAALPARYVPWRARSFALHFAPHDICLIPIEKNPFNICKTANRVVTSLVLGVPVIADEIPSYEQLGDWILFGNWPESIARYAQDPELVQRHVRQAQDYIRRTYNEGRLVEQWSNVIVSVLDRPEEDNAPP